MNTIVRRACQAAAIASVALCLLGPVSQQAAAAVYAYPLNNQSAQQQQRDESECDRWATERTGFDPRRPPQYYGGGYSSPPPSGQSGFFGQGAYGQGGGISDAGKGAAVGAIGGAIAGNAGKGAAIGALSGLFIGGVKRSNQAAEREAWERQQAQQQAQQQGQYQNQIAQLQAEHDRAFAACMSGRGYRVN
jgi:hypothetical protein